MIRYYVSALRRNYRWRRGVDALCAFHVLRAMGHFSFAASEWRLIRDNAWRDVETYDILAEFFSA
jgi:hypothetical protein